MLIRPLSWTIVSARALVAAFGYHALFQLAFVAFFLGIHSQPLDTIYVQCKYNTIVTIAQLSRLVLKSAQYPQSEWLCGSSAESTELRVSGNV